MEPGEQTDQGSGSRQRRAWISRNVSALAEADDEHWCQTSRAEFVGADVEAEAGEREQEEDVSRLGERIDHRGRQQPHILDGHEDEKTDQELRKISSDAMERVLGVRSRLAGVVE
jgi:hypothetical protein